VVPDWQPQTPFPKQIGFAPLHAVVDCQSELVQRSRAALPEHRSAPSLQTQLPDAQTGESPAQAAWFVQVLF
jgi:hypothetical protein